MPEILATGRLTFDEPVEQWSEKKLQAGQEIENTGARGVSIELKKKAKPEGSTETDEQLERKALNEAVQVVRVQIEGALAPVMVLNGGTRFVRIHEAGSTSYPQFTENGAEKATPTVYPNSRAKGFSAALKTVKGSGRDAQPYAYQGAGSGERAPSAQIFSEPPLTGGIDTFGVVGPE